MAVAGLYDIFVNQSCIAIGCLPKVDMPVLWPRLVALEKKVAWDQGQRGEAKGEQKCLYSPTLDNTIYTSYRQVRNTGSHSKAHKFRWFKRSGIRVSDVFGALAHVFQMLSMFSHTFFKYFRCSGTRVSNVLNPLAHAFHMF